MAIRSIACLVIGSVFSLSLAFGSANAQQAAEEAVDPGTQNDAVEPADAKQASAEAPVPAEARSDPGATPSGGTPPPGWRALTRNDRVYWCKREIRTGSRVQQQLTCVSPDQLEAVRDAAQSTVEDSQRKVTQSLKGG